MQITISKNIETRKELESFVLKTFGNDPNVNKEVEIEATEEQLASMSLSETTTIHGAKIKKKISKK